MSEPSSEETFHSIFDALTPEIMLTRIRSELEWQPFERFIEYVFRRAGYVTENTGLQFGQGIDLPTLSGAGQTETAWLCLCQAP